MCAPQCANCLSTEGHPSPPPPLSYFNSENRDHALYCSRPGSAGDHGFLKINALSIRAALSISVSTSFFWVPLSNFRARPFFLEAHPLSPLYPQVPPYSTPPTRRRMLHPQPRGDWPETFSSQCQTRQVPGRMGTNEGRTYPPQGRFYRHPRSGRAHINPF